ncbi:MAG: acyl carrier protein [Myxococcota bacterium]
MAVPRNEIIERVNKTLSDEFEVPIADLLPEKRLREDLELDSLDAVDMIVALEKGFAFRIDEDEAKKISTVGDIYDFVEKMVAAQSTESAPEPDSLRTSGSAQKS